MKKILIVLFVVQIMFLISPSISHEIDYNKFSSIEEVIEYETSLIDNLNFNGYDTLSDLYISRGESYLIAEKFELALHDFFAGYELSNTDQEDIRNTNHFRSLFGMAIAYANLNILDKFYDAIEAMEAILNACGCAKNSILNVVSDAKTRIEIAGPDRIPVQQCIQYVEKTKELCNVLIFNAKPEAQCVLNIVINDLAKRASTCCVQGGLWKACLKPILEKWNKWNQKWQILGIPPDPAWD